MTYFRANQIQIKIDRRNFLKSLAAGFVGVGISPAGLLADVADNKAGSRQEIGDLYIKDYLHKMTNFDRPHKNDVYMERKDFLLLESSVRRFKRLQQTVGHGNFHLLDFDDAIKIACNYSKVGAFSSKELSFIEMVFYNDPSPYGFFGEKPVKNLTDRIRRKEVVKIPGTGNFLYKGLPLETYKKIKKDLGDIALLTSGVRSVIKQFLLFLNRTYDTGGNLSLASRSLAPPGYSFHGISDFDIGQAELGSDNFTERFVTTEVYRRLKEMGFLNLRYPQNNPFGVRFEPWHIKVHSRT